jgi:hypothetical protein
MESGCFLAMPYAVLALLYIIRNEGMMGKVKADMKVAKNILSRFHSYGASSMFFLMI